MILSSIAGITVLAAFALPGLNTEYSMRQFLPPKHALLDADAYIRRKFQLETAEPFFVMISMPKEIAARWDTSGLHLAKLDKLTHEVKMIPGVAKAISIATVEGAGVTKEGITVGKLSELTTDEKLSERIQSDPILSPHLLTKDGTTAVLVVALENVPISQSRLLQAQVEENAKFDFPGFEVRLAGVPVIQSEMSSLLVKELGNFFALSILASLFTLFLFFRTVSSLLVPMALIIVANVICLACMVWTGVAFTVLSTTLPVLVAMTVVSMCTHTMLRFGSDFNLKSRTGNSVNKLQILWTSFSSLVVPNTLTAMTTSIGFFAIAFTETPLIRQYGITIGGSIFVCWFLVIVALLPCLVLLPVPVIRDWTEARANWVLWVTKYNKLTIVSITIFSVFFLAQGSKMNWSARLFDDLPEQHKARLATEYFDQNIGGMIPLDLIIELPTENAWNDPVLLEKLHSTKEKWAANSKVGSAVSGMDYLKIAARLQGKANPTTRKEVAELGFLYTFSEENPLKKYLSVDGRAAHVGFRLHDIAGNEMLALVGKMKQDFQQTFPEAKVQLGGMGATVHAINNELSGELIFGFWQALALIGIVLAFAFRSIRWSLASLLPNLVPPSVLLGAIYFTGTPIKPGIALIFSIALGISFDNTVYLLGRLRFLRDRSQTGKIQITKAWYQEGNLCLFSSLALSAGFLVFLVSFFAVNRFFGFYMLISILGGLLGDLVLLPAMLTAFPWLLGKSKEPRSNVVYLNTHNQQESVMKEVSDLNVKTIAASIALLFIANEAAAAVDATDAKQLLAQVQNNISSNSEVASVKMTIIEPDGTQKDRGIEIRRKGEEDQQKVLVRIQAPADLKGTGLLSVSKGKESDQWVYLPSSKQTRRIISSKKSSSFFDSELSYEDMGTNSDKKFQSKVLRQEVIQGKKFAVVENTTDSDSSYSKILVWIDLSTYLVGKMEYYDKSSKLLKTSIFSNYKQFAKGVWRAQKIQVSNAQTKRGTVLELSDLAVNKSISDDEFTEVALTDE